MEQALALENRTTRVGRFWFQYRSVSPLPFLIPMLLLPPGFVPGVGEIFLGLALVVLAEGVRLWAVGYAGSATRTRGVEVPALVHAGPYRWVRNPLYLANILLYTTLGFLFGFRGLTVGIFLYSIVQYSFIVRFEEGLLTEIFGEPYRAFMEKVPRWVPLLTDPYPTSSQDFSLARAVRSERSTLIALGAVLLSLVIKRSVF